MQTKWQRKYQRSPGKWVFVPTEESRAEGKAIKEAVEDKWQPPTYYYHLRAGGHVASLRSHVNNTYFLRLDIQDFFGSITRSRVTRSLKKMFGYEKARQIANDSTVKHPADKNRAMLPYGFVQSPTLASLALFDSRLGGYLEQLEKRKYVVVSVYMDDIIVSTKRKKPLADIHKELVAASVKSRFDFHPDKTEGPAIKITAFNIELGSGDIQVTPERLQEFYDAFKKTSSLLEKNGIAEYVSSVNPAQATLLV